jgi:hypothetical protein
VSALDALKLEAAALRNDGVDVAVDVLHGPLAATVWRFCVAQGATLMVVGDTNHLTSALFESSLDQFAHGIDIPLLVVRDEAPLLGRAAGSRASGGGRRAREPAIERPAVDAEHPSGAGLVAVEPRADRARALRTRRLRGTPDAVTSLHETHERAGVGCSRRGTDSGGSGRQ